MDPNLPVIDLDLGAELLGSDKASAKRMIKELAVLLSGNLSSLKLAYAEADRKKMGDVAHYVYGGSCYCGTPRLKVAARALEKSIKISGSLDELTPVYQELCKEIEAVLAKSIHLAE